MSQRGVGRELTLEQPLLSYFSRNRGIATTVLESPNPFLVPHIAIEEAPQPPYWECDYNRIPEQEAMYGQWLTVPNGRPKRRRHTQQEVQELQEWKGFRGRKWPESSVSVSSPKKRKLTLFVKCFSLVGSNYCSYNSMFGISH